MFDIFLNPMGALVGLGMAVAGVLAVWWHGRRKGSRAAQEAQMRERMRAREKADDIEADVAGRSAAENREELEKWLRR